MYQVLKFGKFINENVSNDDDLLTRLKFEMTSNSFINYTTGEITAGYTPLTLEESREAIKNLSYDQAVNVFNNSDKLFFEYIDAEINGSKSHDVAMPDFLSHLKKIDKNVKFNVGIQTAIDDVDEFTATKMSDNFYDVSIPFRTYDKELGYVQHLRNMGTCSPKQLKDLVFGDRDADNPYVKCWFSNDGIKSTVVEAVKKTVKKLTLTARHFVLFSDVLAKKYPALKNQITEELEFFKNHQYRKMKSGEIMCADGYRKLWDMYM